ncbi:MAG: queuosine precursor transporter [Parachlamydiales bacterium]
MNELVFCAHLVVNLVFLLGALKLGRLALVLFFALEVVLANLLVLKQISFLGLSVTATDVYAVGAILALNLIQEYYGKEAAKKGVVLTFFALVLFLVMTQFQLFYQPAAADGAAEAYALILQKMPRLITFSVAVFLIVQKIDLEIYGYLQKKAQKSGAKERFFFRRLFLAAFFSQTVDTVLFSFFALFGLMANLFHVIFMALMVKYLLILTSSSLVAFFKKRVRAADEI